MPHRPASSDGQSAAWIWRSGTWWVTPWVVHGAELAEAPRRYPLHPFRNAVRRPPADPRSLDRLGGTKAAAHRTAALPLDRYPKFAALWRGGEPQLGFGKRQIIQAGAEDPARGRTIRQVHAGQPALEYASRTLSRSLDSDSTPSVSHSRCLPRVPIDRGLHDLPAMRLIREITDQLRMVHGVGDIDDHVDGGCSVAVVSRRSQQNRSSDNLRSCAPI
jgi:hypothetical protein